MRSQALLRDGEIGEAGRDHDGLLRSADEDVDAPGVHVEVRGAEAGDGVDDEQRVVAGVAQDLRDAGGAVADASRGLGGLHEDDSGFELEGGLDFVKREGLAVGGGDDVDGAAEVFGQRGPALTELAGGEDENAVAGAGEVGHGGLHGSGARGGEEDDVVLGADEFAEVGEGAGEEGAELGRAVVDVGGGHGELGSGEEGGGAGGEEAGFADHAAIVEGAGNARGLRLVLLRDDCSPMSNLGGSRP